MNHFLPIAGLIRREMLMALRRKSNMFWLIVLLLCFVLMIVANWPTNDRLFLGRVGYMSRDILIHSCLILMVGATLFLPATVMGIFDSDFERDRADMLRLTLLTPEAIGIGKVWQAFENAAPMVLGIACSTVVPLVLVTDW